MLEIDPKITLGFFFFFFFGQQNVLTVPWKRNRHIDFPAEYKEPLYPVYTHSFLSDLHCSVDFDSVFLWCHARIRFGLLGQCISVGLSEFSVQWRKVFITSSMQFVVLIQSKYTNIKCQFVLAWFEYIPFISGFCIF